MWDVFLFIVTVCVCGVCICAHVCECVCAWFVVVRDLLYPDNKLLIIVSSFH